MILSKYQEEPKSVLLREKKNIQYEKKPNTNPNNTNPVLTKLILLYQY